MITHKGIDETYHLNIGDMVLVKTPGVVSTLLGSCVSITMYDPGRRIGAMCHAALAQCPEETKCRKKRCLSCGKFVKCAIKVMTTGLKTNSIYIKDIEVKLFGGAKLFNQDDRKDFSLDIGAANVAAAKRIISEAGMTIKASDTEGYNKRKIFFDLSTGKVFIQKNRKILG